MNSSLDFLKATDSKRKEFLISLLSLDKYVTIHNQVKAATKEAKSQTDALSGEVKAIERSINQTPKDLTLKEEPIIPEVDDTLLEKSFDIKAKLREVDRVKSLIEQHGKLVEKLNNLPIIPAVSKPKTDLETLKSDKLKLTNQINEIVKSISDTKTNITKLKRGTGNCSSCGQTLPSASSNQEKISEQSLALQELESKLENLGSADKYDSLVLEHTRYNEYLREESDRASKQAQLQEQINSLGDVSAYSIEDISETEYHNVKKEYENQVAEQKKATALLDEVRKWNSRVDAKVEQLEKNKAELKEVTKKLVSATSRYNMLKVLQDAFGPKGLVQYKIESNIKVFEGLINDYLVMLSNGDFNIRFIIEDSKLKISVFQQGQEINMNSASSGEFNNINTATLLAVRKMMSSISKVSINLLMLDEVISVLDVQSRENLIDILIKENNLNSVVVSHGFEHPLAESLTISKENNISICK
jgi:DNA repair exonuclease SbcCD ATPase subunit